MEKCQLECMYVNGKRKLFEKRNLISCIGRSSTKWFYTEDAYALSRIICNTRPTNRNHMYTSNIYLYLLKNVSPPCQSCCYRSHIVHMKIFNHANLLYRVIDSLYYHSFLLLSIVKKEIYEKTTKRT